MEIMHPRPSPIAAAMYTLRDLGADAIILHGPPGCNFRTSRILEEDGVRVFTTGMLEYDFIFGGKNKLLSLLRRLEEKFSFELIGIVGTCASMIIGDDIELTVKSGGFKSEILLVETHGGFADNTIGAIQTLQAAVKNKLIDEQELIRQDKMLKRATEVEKSTGMASMEYIKPSRGDDKIKVARKIINFLKEDDSELLVIMNAKKELAYIFSDILSAINEIGKIYDSNIINIANLDPNIGLPRIRGYADNIIKGLAEKDIKIDHIIGGLDEYSVAGDVACRLVNEEYAGAGNSIIIGTPHGVSLEDKRIAITNGPREVEPLRKMGYEDVIVELDAHSLVVGVDNIVTSDFGSILRTLSDV
ncbi:MAG: Ni-sirohydrochlorin a,c-diamide reductive cyclase catalytic subunit [Halobacteriota archaeon]|nr:Ni-sirohydrochlorin a,c-diamide reductive cyclase catalytic subunit [Halobacteriota archaeon]